jgi:membrane-bound metal-dependent hydrolase YbcI (DUF457 family)
MDPIAHTLVGASLAQTGLKRLSTFGTLTLLLAANAPDIDAFTMFLGRDVSLGARRGWTHGVLAIAVLPVALAGLVWLLGRIRAPRDGAQAPHFTPLLVLSGVGVLTHPLLDWLNTYGIRLLMPFDGRWFYGDALFIVDPWVWLLAAEPARLAPRWCRRHLDRRRHGTGLMGNPGGVARRPGWHRCTRPVAAAAGAPTVRRGVPRGRGAVRRRDGRGKSRRRWTGRALAGEPRRRGRLRDGRPGGRQPLRARHHRLDR